MPILLRFMKGVAGALGFDQCFALASSTKLLTPENGYQPCQDLRSPVVQSIALHASTRAIWRWLLTFEGLRPSRPDKIRIMVCYVFNQRVCYYMCVMWHRFCSSAEVAPTKMFTSFRLRIQKQFWGIQGTLTNFALYCILLQLNRSNNLSIYILRCPGSLLLISSSKGEISHLELDRVFAIWLKCFRFKLYSIKECLHVRAEVTNGMLPLLISRL